MKAISWMMMRISFIKIQSIFLIYLYFRRIIMDETHKMSYFGNPNYQKMIATPWDEEHCYQIQCEMFPMSTSLG
jgi:hypothetical protein